MAANVLAVLDLPDTRSQDLLEKETAENLDIDPAGGKVVVGR